VKHHVGGDMIEYLLAAEALKSFRLGLDNLPMVSTQSNQFSEWAVLMLLQE